MLQSKLTRIPSYISARSPLALRRLMLANNVKLGGEVKYFDIQFVDGRWWAWFYIDIEDDRAFFSKADQKQNGTIGGVD